MKMVIDIPQNATNGDMIKALFPNVPIEMFGNIVTGYFDTTETNPRTVAFFTKKWWETLYEKGAEE